MPGAADVRFTSSGLCGPRVIVTAPYEEAHPYDFQLYDSRFKSMDDPASQHDIYVPVRLQ